MKRDWKQFSELRRAVQLRYQETIDVKEFEPKIQKLLDDHVDVRITAQFGVSGYQPVRTWRPV
jgi:hypothetical protein